MLATRRAWPMEVNWAIEHGTSRPNLETILDSTNTSQIVPSSRTSPMTGSILPPLCHWNEWS
jgi:hypothetical protein